MIAGQNVLAIVPARGGSKGVPDKNIRPLGGKPLLAWSVEVAKATPAIDRVLVSTDSEKIAEVARACGAEVMLRPAHLATDTALVIDTVRDILARVYEAGDDVDIVVLLEPTSPLRHPDDVTSCLEMLGKSAEGYDSVATFTEAELNPHRAWTIQDGYPRPFIAGAVPWLPRQQLPEAFQLSGAVYAFFVHSLPAEGVSFIFGRAGGILMPKARSYDIDTELDFEVAEALLKRSGYAT